MQANKYNVSLKKACEQFAKGSLQVKSGCDLFAIFGHKKAGKTIAADLLEGVQLEKIDDLEIKSAVVVRHKDHLQQYPTKYMAVHGGRIVAESFTLQECSQENSVQQAIKLIYLEELMKIASRVSLIIVCEEKSIASIHLHLQQFLSCLGISEIKKDKRLEAIKEHIYLLLTKTKEAKLQQCLKAVAGVKARNDNVTELLQFFINNPKRCKLFPAKTPSSEFAMEVLDTFTPKKKSNELLDILSQSLLRKKDEYFAEKDAKYIFDILISISKMLRSLTQYGVSQEKTQHRRSYEAQAKVFFYPNPNKRKIEIMIGNWTAECLPQSMPVVGTGKNQFACLAEWLMQLCFCFESSNTAAQKDFKQLGLMVFFCCNLSSWLKMDQKTQERFNKEINSHQVVHQKYAPKPKTKPKEVKKKPYQLFSESIKQQCKTNLDALQLCLQNIKEKQKQLNFDYFEVIFEIKLLLHLLDCLNSQHPHLFIKELLELSLYSESSFLLFTSYLETAFKQTLLEYSQSKLLIKQLRARQKYRECLRIIDYLIAIAIDPEYYGRLFQLKNSVRAQQRQGLIAIDKPQRQNSSALTFSLQTIKAKIKKNPKLQQILSLNTFSHFFDK